MKVAIKGSIIIIIITYILYQIFTSKYFFNLHALCTLQFGVSQGCV